MKVIVKYSELDNPWFHSQLSKTIRNAWVLLGLPAVLIILDLRSEVRIPSGILRSE